MSGNVLQRRHFDILYPWLPPLAFASCAQCLPISSKFQSLLGQGSRDPSVMTVVIFNIYTVIEEDDIKKYFHEKGKKHKISSATLFRFFDNKVKTSNYNCASKDHRDKIKVPDLVVKDPISNKL